MPDERAPLLPELVRSLRALGRSGDAGADLAHAAVFAPLLEARARAGAGGAPDVVDAFRGAALAARIESQVRAAAGAGRGNDAQARASTAEADEMLEPLRAELARLDQLAGAAVRDGPASPEWTGWLAQLRRVFAAADTACLALGTVLGPSPRSALPPRRWFGRADGR